MDSVTQALLGAGVAGAVAPSGHRRKALFLGATLGTLPDLDVFIDFGGAVENFTQHRGFSHSLLVLASLALLLWASLLRAWPAAREAPFRWLVAIATALLTHPLLDAHTIYGTQLWWPLDRPPVQWGTLFIIDPQFTVPLLLGVALAAAWPRRRWSTGLLGAFLALSLTYLAWSWVAQDIAREAAERSFTAAHSEADDLLVTPTPFNTWRWRIVRMTAEGYEEGFFDLFSPGAPVRFRSYPSDVEALQQAAALPAVERLHWFARGFVAGVVRDERLAIVDLRMGQEPNYAFTHVVARRAQDGWQAVPTVRLPAPYDRRQALEALRRAWSSTGGQGRSASAPGEERR